MSLIQKLIDAQDNQDLKAYNEVVSEDYVWIKHSTGEEIPRDELSKWLISPDAPKTESCRIIYENNEIGVAHYFISFKDGSRQAVLVVYIIKDGKIIRSETGATAGTVFSTCAIPFLTPIPSSDCIHPMNFSKIPSPDLNFAIASISFSIFSPFFY